MFGRTIDRLRMGFAMARASWHVVRRHPKLLLLPLVSVLAVGALAATAFVPHGLVALVTADAQAGRFQEGGQGDLIVLLWLFAYYVALWFVVIFFNTALTFSALRALETDRASLREGLTVALYRVPQILGWALLASTVGVLLSVITGILKDKLDFIGDLLGSLLQSAWAIAAYFVAPVMAVEGLGPIAALRRSGEIMKRTWGETLGGEGGVGIVSFLLLLPLLVLVPLLFAFVHWTGGDVAAVRASTAMVVLFAVYFAAVFVVTFAMGTVVRGALYLYASKGAVPAGFEPGRLAGAFHPKR